MSSGFWTRVTGSIRFSFDPYDRDARVVTGNLFHHLAYAPTGQVYVSVPFRAKYYHLMSNLDADEVLKVTFTPRGIQLPVFNMQSLPFLPNIKLAGLSGSPCDTLVGFLDTEDPAEGRSGATVFPNPAAEEVFFLLVSVPSATVRVFFYNVVGQEIYSEMLDNDQTNITLDVSQWSQGLYHWRIQHQQNGTIASGRFVVSRK